MSKIVYKPLTPKRQTEILKSYDEMSDRILVKSWKTDSSRDWKVRLMALAFFQPQLSCRKVLILARLNKEVV